MAVTKRRRMIAALIVVLGVLPVLLCFGWVAPFLVLVYKMSLPEPALDERQLERAIGELRGQAFATGIHRDVLLPAPFRSMSQFGKVDVVRTADGRTIALFRTSVGHKGNYRGIVYCDGALRPGELGIDDRGRPVMIPILDTYIRKVMSGRHYEVYYNLG